MNKSKVTNKTFKLKKNLDRFATIQKYQAGIRAHKRINLLDNDSSSEEDDSQRISYFQQNKNRVVYGLKSGKVNTKHQQKSSKERRQFVTLTKIDLSDSKNLNR